MEKFILVSGGTRGIGRAIALSQAQKGATLFVNFLRDEESAESLKSEAAKKGAEVQLIQANVGDPDEIQTLFSEIQKKTKRLDAVIHCAALGVFKPVHQ